MFFTKNIRIRKSEFLAKTQLLCKTSQIYEESFKIPKPLQPDDVNLKILIPKGASNIPIKRSTVF